MKNLITIALVLISFNLFSQKIIKDEVDKFTGAHIIETSWEKFTAKKIFSFIKVRQVDMSYYLDLKILPFSGVFAVRAGEVVYLSFNNGDVLKLSNLEHTISERGAGSINIMGSNTQGLELSFLLTGREIKKLSTESLKGMRVYTTDGYIETVFKQKHLNKIKAVFLFFNKEE